ncbi:MAG: choice-of-anchor P family protein [Gemmatimonadales bacterium]
MKTLNWILVLLCVAPGWLAGQGVSAEAFGVSVRTATLNQKAGSAVLPADGSVAQTQAGDLTVATLVTAQDAFATAAGVADASQSDAFSSATLGSVSILNGLITADGVVAMASSTSGNSNAEGSSLANLVVNGVQVSNPAPNTRVNLPGVGYVVLNEQMSTSGGITVNMIHVVLQQQVLGISRTTGDIVVGSASSSVN